MLIRTFDKAILLFEINQRVLREILRIRNGLLLLNRRVVHLLLNLFSSEFFSQLCNLFDESKLVSDFDFEPLLDLMCLRFELEQKLNLLITYVCFG